LPDGDCIITGGAGFIGCALSRRIANRFRRVIIVDNLNSQVHPEQRRPEALDVGVEFYHADVTVRETWNDVLAEVHPRAIVHLAAETGTAQSLTEATRHGEVNVIGTTQMLDALATTGRLPEQILLASSRAVYGEGIWQAADGTAVYPGQRSRAQLERGEWDFPGLTPVPFEATTTAPHPTSIYGATKLAQEHIITAWALAFGIEPVVLRLQNVIGAGQSLFNSYTGIVTLFCRLARQGEAIPVYEDGQITRDFVHVEDVVEAMVAALTRPHTSIPGASNLSAGGLMSAPLDVGSGKAHSIAELASWIAAHYGAPDPVVNGAFRLGDVRHAACDISRTMAALDWQPRRTFEDGLRQICEWIDATFA
jgi:dTDP-L-rhamnose 4-epimerase